MRAVRSQNSVVTISSVGDVKLQEWESQPGRRGEGGYLQDDFRCLLCNSFPETPPSNACMSLK